MKLISNAEIRHICQLNILAHSLQIPSGMCQAESLFGSAGRYDTGPE